MRAVGGSQFFGIVEFGVSEERAGGGGNVGDCVDHGAKDGAAASFVDTEDAGGA